MLSDEHLTLIELNEQAVTTLLNSVNRHLDSWSGGDPQEQINLQQLQLTLRTAALEYQFNK